MHSQKIYFTTVGAARMSLAIASEEFELIRTKTECNQINMKSIGLFLYNDSRPLLGTPQATKICDVPNGEESSEDEMLTCVIGESQGYRPSSYVRS